MTITKKGLIRFATAVAVATTLLVAAGIVEADPSRAPALHDPGVEAASS